MDKKPTSQSRLFRLSEGPPFLYAALYFAAIPTFALVYFLPLSGQFYHTTVQLEPALREYRSSLEQGLRQQLTYTFERAHGVGRVETGGLIFARERSSASWLFLNFTNLKGMDLEAHLDFTTERADGSRESHAAILTIPIALSREESRPKVTKGFRPLLRAVVWYPWANPNTDIAGLTTAIFPNASLEPTSTSSFKVWVPLDFAFLEQLSEYRYLMEGRPSALTPGNFVRMLYLRSVTLTTLGLGDIVPLTSTSRLAVAAESVVGALLVGLFLNALVRPTR